MLYAFGQLITTLADATPGWQLIHEVNYKVNSDWYFMKDSPYDFGLQFEINPASTEYRSKSYIRIIHFNTGLRANKKFEVG